MATKFKIIKKFDLIEYNQKYNDKSYDVRIYLLGLFDTSKVRWKYYLMSGIDVNNNILITVDLCSTNPPNPVIPGITGNVETFCQEYKNVEDATSFAETFKLKWESNSNDTTQEVRDRKINEVLK